MVTAFRSKRSRRLCALAVVSTFAFAFATSASGHRSDFRPGTWPSQTVLIGYSSEPALESALRGRNARVVARVPALHTVAVDPSGDAASFASDLAGTGGIDFVQAPVPRRHFVEPGLAPAAVPGGSYQWQYALTGADRVPDRVARAAAGVRVAIVDSGADLSAPDLEAKRPLTYNAVNNSRDVADPVGHGTFVASLAAGSASNGEGMAGVAGEAQLTTIKASMEGRFTDFEVAAAIAYAVDTGAKVVNLSVGGTKSSQTERRAIEYAFAKDVLLVAAAGNEALKGNPVEYPAAHLQPVGSNGAGGYGLSVGASTSTGARAEFSNHGSYLSLAAPGEEVFGAISKDSSPLDYPRVKLPGSAKGLYGYSSGTSFAAPQVAGAAALVWAANRALSSRQVADILKQTASGGGGWNPELGYGVINVAAAVEVAGNTPAVSLKADKFNDTAHLSWRGTTGRESAYRILSLGTGRSGEGPRAEHHRDVAEHPSREGRDAHVRRRVARCGRRGDRPLGASGRDARAGEGRIGPDAVQVHREREALLARDRDAPSQRSGREARTAPDRARAALPGALAVRRGSGDGCGGPRDLGRATRPPHDPRGLPEVLGAPVCEQPSR